jgi:hypothetical protein
MIKFKIEYDDQPNDVVDKMAAKLKLFGILIKPLDGGDGFEEYEIIRDPGLEDESHSLDLLMNHMLEDDPELFGDID